MPGGKGTVLREPEDWWVLPADRSSSSTARKAASLYETGLEERGLSEAEPVTELVAGVELEAGAVLDDAGMAFGGYNGGARGGGMTTTPSTLHDSVF